MLPNDFYDEGKGYGYCRKSACSFTKIGRTVSGVIVLAF